MRAVAGLDILLKSLILADLLLSGTPLASAAPVTVAPEPVVSFRVRLANLPKFVRALPAPAWKGLQEKLRRAVGLDLTDAGALTGLGVDLKRDLVFSMGAYDLDRVHRAARLSFSRFVSSYLKFVEKKGQSPLPVTWFELSVPVRRVVDLLSGLAEMMRRLTRDPKLKARIIRGRIAGKPGTYNLWSSERSGFSVAAWASSSHVHIRMMLRDEARFERGVPSLPARSFSTTTRMKRCGFGDGGVGLYVDGQGLARYSQLTALIRTFSAVAGMDPKDKARFFARGGAESQVFERLQRASAALFTHLCINETGSRWGLTSSAARILAADAAASRRLSRALMAHLARLARMRPGEIKHGIRDGADLAARYMGAFLWPVVLSSGKPGERGLGAVLESAFLNKPFEVKPKTSHLYVRTDLMKHLFSRMR